MLSMCAEVLTGKGALQQLGFETGLPIGDLDGLILGVAAFNVLAALLPAKVRPTSRVFSHAPANRDTCETVISNSTSVRFGCPIRD